MLIQDQFGVIQNLQMSPVTGHEIFFCRFLQQTGSSRPGLELDFRTVLTGTSESMGKTSQAATTYT